MNRAAITLLGFLIAGDALRAEPFRDGDVFAALIDGQIAQASRSGRIRGGLDTGSRGELTGMCFDADDERHGVKRRVVLPAACEGDASKPKVAVPSVLELFDSFSARLSEVNSPPPPAAPPEPSTAG